MNIRYPMLPVRSMEQQLSRLRRAIATSEALPEEARALALGIGAIDAALGGGLECAALHELSTTPGQFGATGFAIALAALAREGGKQALWIATDFGTRETGTLYGPGLDQFGLDTRRLLIAHVPRPIDALFAMEEALRCRALATVVAELAAAPDLTATRRLALAARDGGGLGLLLCHKPNAAPSAARTRWRIAPAPSEPDEFGGLGRTAFALTLLRNRRGPCGTWTVSWDHHAYAFQALSVGMAEAAFDRPDRTALAG